MEITLGREIKYVKFLEGLKCKIIGASEDFILLAVKPSEYVDKYNEFEPESVYDSTYIFEDVDEVKNDFERYKFVENLEDFYDKALIEISKNRADENILCWINKNCV